MVQRSTGEDYADDIYRESIEARPTVRLWAYMNRTGYNYKVRFERTSRL